MRAKTAFALTLLVLTPGVAMADVGTALIWAGAFHLFLGNLVLGTLEGLILARLYALPRRRCIPLLILANYLSSWAGLVYAVPRLERWLKPDLYSGPWVAAGLVGATFAMTLVLEWPFVALCVRGTAQWLKKSVVGSLIVQTAGYVVLFGGYALVSAASLYTSHSIVRRELVPLPAGVQLFYIGAEGDVYRVEGASAPTRVLAFRSTDPRDSLRLQRQRGDSTVWDLIAVHAAGRGKESTAVVAAAVARHPRDSLWNSLQEPAYPRNPLARLGAAAESPWRFRTSPWPDEGLTGRHTGTGERIKLALGTPLMAWGVWNAVHLPGEKILFTLGQDQICLLEIGTRRVAMVARGQGQVALLTGPANARGGTNP